MCLPFSAPKRVAGRVSACRSTIPPSFRQQERPRHVRFVRLENVENPPDNLEQEDFLSARRLQGAQEGYEVFLLLL